MADETSALSVVVDRLAGACAARQWHEVSEALREEPLSEQDRNAVRWHVVAFDYELVQPAGRPHGPREPALLPKALFEGGGSYPPPVEELPQEAVVAWREAATVAPTPLMAARYRDLLWHRREGRAVEHALAAIGAYLDLANDPDAHDGIMVVSASSRALELSRMINAVNLQRLSVAAAVSGATRELDLERPRPGIAIRLLALLHQLPVVERPPELKPLLLRCEDAFGTDAYVCEDVAEMLIGHSSDDAERAATIARQIARWESRHERGLGRLTDLRDAAIFAESYGAGDEARRLRRLAERIPPADLELQTITGEFEIPTAQVDELIAILVGDDDYVSGLLRVGSYGPPSGDPERTAEVVRDIAEATPFLHLGQRTVLGPEGSILRVTQSVDEAIEVEIPRHEATSISLTSHVLARALDELAERYGVPEVAALTLALTSDFVLQPTAEAFARAIRHYHAAEFDAAGHLTAPRIERPIRAIARALGISVTTPPAGDRPGGVRSVGDLLHDLRGSLPEPWRRYYMNLLVDPFGLNLRNSISHSLIDYVDRPTSAILIHAAVRLTLFGIVDPAANVDPAADTAQAPE